MEYNDERLALRKEEMMVDRAILPVRILVELVADWVPPKIVLAGHISTFLQAINILVILHGSLRKSAFKE